MHDGDLDPMLLGALYGMAKNQQRATDPNLYRHTHGPGHYHSHVGSHVHHRHPVAHSMDYVRDCDWEAYERGDTTRTYVRWTGLDAFVMFLCWEFFGTIVLSVVAVLIAPGITERYPGQSIAALVVIAGYLYFTYSRYEGPIVQYVDGGSGHVRRPQLPDDQR